MWWFSHAPSLQNASIYAGVMYDMGVLPHHITTETFSLHFRATTPMESVIFVLIFYVILK